MFENLKQDVRAATLSRRPKLQSGFAKEDFKTCLQLSTVPVIAYRFGRWARGVRVPVVRNVLVLCAGLLRRCAAILTGTYISPDAQIGPGLVIHTLYGINIGATRIGRNCTVQTGVLIAAGSRGIGDNVYFGAGAKVIADTAIGNNVVIVANSLVLTDVADNTTIVGVPARIKLRGGRPQKFPQRSSSPPESK
jgi:serine O-acetyltransferase